MGAGGTRELRTTSPSKLKVSGRDLRGYTKKGHCKLSSVLKPLQWYFYLPRHPASRRRADWVWSSARLFWKTRGIPGLSSGWDRVFSLLRAGVQSLVRELTSHKLCGATKKKYAKQNLLKCTVNKDIGWKKYFKNFVLQLDFINLCHVSFQLYLKYLDFFVECVLSIKMCLYTWTNQLYHCTTSKVIMIYR